MNNVNVMQTQERPAELGSRIKQLRKASGLSQTEVAEPLVSASHLSLIESGARRPSRRVLDHIAERLGVDSEELLTGHSRKEEMGLDLHLQESRELIRTGQLSGAAQIAEQVTERAQRLGFHRIEARGCEVLASIEERHARIEVALALYRRAETLWGGEPPHLAFETKAGLARCHLALGDPRLAVHLVETYLLDLQTDGVPDPTATMRSHATLVMCYTALGLPEKAVHAADKAEALSPRVLDSEQLACMRMNVARSLYEQGNMDDALDAIRSAEEAYLTLGWQIDAAGARLNRAIVQMAKGSLEEARLNLTAALDVYRGADQPVHTARVLNELGRLERLSERTDEGIRVLEEAQRYLEKGDLSERGLNLREYGLCLQGRDPEEAKGNLRRAIDLYVLAGNDKEVARTYKLLGDLHGLGGEIEASARAYRAGIEALE